MTVWLLGLQQSKFAPFIVAFVFLWVCLSFFFFLTGLSRSTVLIGGLNGFEREFRIPV